MKNIFEFLHSKLWTIEQKGNKINIEFGKTGSVMRTKTYSYKTVSDATDDCNKRIAEKLKKGYIKKGAKINLDTNPFIDFLIKIGDKIGAEMDKLHKSNDIDYVNKMTIFCNKNFSSLEKQINDFQNKKIQHFIKSGVIVKNINNKFKNNLLNDINLYAKKIQPDYHPGSNNKVLDIVHPSLYPLVLEKTKRLPELDFWNRPYEHSKYQWLPSEFKIDSAGKCKIMSYINNIPISEQSLYDNISMMFETVLPYFENIWSYTNSFEIYKDDWIKVADTKFKKISLKNRNLQVITKIVRISLNSDELLGAWHVEGMSHENIVATATYTLEQESIETELYFKRMYGLKEVQNIVENMPQNPPEELKSILQTLVPLGKVKISEGTLVLFPNSHIHKINMTSKNSGYRTIIVFWLINPDIKITSTKNIKQQAYKLETAHNIRLELMKERTYYKQSFNQRELNLCEH
jgi:predicted DNA-binding WGR domain protein